MASKGSAAGLTKVTPFGAAASILGDAAATATNSSTGPVSGGYYQLDGLSIGAGSDQLYQGAAIAAGVFGLAWFLFRRKRRG